MAIALVAAFLSPADTVRAYARPGPDAPEPTVSSAGFTHPGVFVSLDSLRTSRRHVSARDEPWATVFQQLRSSPYATREGPDFSQFASAGAVDPLSHRCGLKDSAGCVSYCGSFSVPDVGCTDARLDARAVYAQALMYWYTGDAHYAQRAIAILNGYARHFRGNTGSNGPLVTAWLGQTMLRGAEILRYTYVPDADDVAFDVRRFSEMLRNTAVPTLSTFDYGTYNGNWKLSAADGLINAAVFLDDRKLYDRAVAMWREAVPAYIYLATDGDHPVAPPNASGLYQTSATLGCLWLANNDGACETMPKTEPAITYQNGQTQESCRDFGHTALGLGAIVNTAETAWIQGDDLYGEQQHRILPGILYAVHVSQAYEKQGWPRDFCGGATGLNTNLSLANLAAEVAYNAYAVRKRLTLTAIPIPGYTAPNPTTDPLASFIADKRSVSNPVGDVSAWESLTHHLADRPTVLTTPTEPTPSRTASPSPTTEGSTEDDATKSFLLLATVTTVALMVASIARWLFPRRKRRGR